jgi:glycosyltransferase involved in cell wall biosynthesis
MQRAPFGSFWNGSSSARPPQNGRDVTRILLANTYFYPAVGGIENYLLNVGRVLASQNIGVGAIASNPSALLPSTGSIDGIRIDRFDFSERRPPCDMFDHLRLLRTFQSSMRQILNVEPYDAVWARDAFSCFAAVQAAPRVPTVYIQATAFPVYTRSSIAVRGRTLPATLYKTFRREAQAHYMARIERKCLARATSVVVLSEVKRQEISSYYGIDPNKLVVVPPGVDTVRYAPVAAPEKTAIRRRLGLPLGSFIFLWVGRPTREKNPMCAVEAFKALANDSGCTLVMVGASGAIESQNPRVLLVEATPEPIEYYQAADAFVLPSLTEGFGQVIIEAMSCGLPCIAFRSPTASTLLATEEIIADGRTGILTDYGDAKALAKAMDELLADRARALRIGSAARVKCQQVFSWTSVVSRLLQLSGLPQPVLTP